MKLRLGEFSNVKLSVEVVCWRCDSGVAIGVRSLGFDSQPIQIGYCVATAAVCP